ncbi:hypothetical protein MHH28_25350 [Paenibacillus sp. FSL K6-1217]|uniref:hypothetical protein n=1 Tax=Paenibacillus sp. FSL K6-1217 TaxID=2921466 RepID=UPI003244D8D7
MPCSQTNLTPISLATPTPVKSYGYTPITEKRLYVCDNPEPLQPSYFTSTSMITLWDDVVPAKSLVKYRVFMWHHNATASTIKYGLTLGTAGAAITVRDIMYETAVTSNGGDILTNAGLCLAKSLLGETLISDPTAITVPAGNVRTIKEFTLEPNQVRGLIMEFTLASAGNMAAKLRTVASSSTSAALNTHSGNPIAPNGTHPRGTWGYADVQGNNITLTIGSTGVSSNVAVLGKEDPANGSNSVFPGPLANEPAFGGIYKVNITITNSSGSAKTANLYLNPRGGLYAGAVKVGSNPVYGISKTRDNEAVKIGGFSLSNGQSITVPVQLTTAGGSSSPIAFIVRS